VRKLAGFGRLFWSGILPLRANRRSFDSGGQQQPAYAQDDNS